MKKFLMIFLTIFLVCGLVGCSSDEEIEVSSVKLQQSLKQNLTSKTLHYVKETKIVEDDTNYLKVDIAYTDDILYEGVVNAITKIVQQECSNEHNEIHLTIIQEEPHDFIKYIYKNKKWNREN
ncbi:hypothetical protein G8V06_09520 [Clostridium botulinum D/C]|uniref:hypothetical protein n=1 Tax=Clostridium botulinum TaxID=1491 RepID=UPI001E348B5E|nr:hypothetical protein [Clostridium botulinum]MCD3234329.1 hypothetical protein [Clostridium botulinum D/C]MCD3240313.1 hypothetical protein [Clostridium botulinum D/C]MCD3267748.1 hypothetical protein [Clostridium botulinum D/C]MCD3306145.1 hypothetical protein [Clostridium botulinum D/C]MCD3314929.1 hypothetical protein [Clostridium botulinum D/C]